MSICGDMSEKSGQDGRAPRQIKRSGRPRSRAKEVRGQKVMLMPLTRPALEEVALWPKHTGPYACYNRKDFEMRESRDEWYARNVEGDISSFWFSIHKLNAEASFSTPNGDLIGILSVYRLKDDPWQREAEIGIEIRPDECDKGYGEDAIKTLLRNIFGKTNFTHLGIGTRKWNKRALRCYEKCGFVPCGELTMMLDGKKVRFTEMELRKDTLQAEASFSTPNPAPRGGRI